MSVIRPAECCQDLVFPGVIVLARRVVLNGKEAA